MTTKAGLTIMIFCAIVLAIVVLIRKGQPPLTTEDLTNLAERDDPPYGLIAPDELMSHLPSRDTWVIYLAECSVCTSKEPAPLTFPSKITHVLFVKTTANDIPSAVAGRPLLIDSSGKVERILNAYRAPRIYHFLHGRLVDWQRLSQSWEAYLGGLN